MPPSSRLQVLHSYDILHSAQEPLFDDLTALAAYIFSVPVARIAFVADEEVWHKASVGMPAQDSLPIEQSICPQAVRHELPVLVFPDLAAQPQFSTPLMRAQHVVFYAGAQLRAPQGGCLGTLCLAGYEPRELTEAEQQMLAHLAELTMLALEARRRLRAADEAGWERLRQNAETELRNQMALVRYLKVRSGEQVPVPADFLEEVSRRLREVAGLLAAAAQG
ncbi:GAF domain-containing protein [Hymenobacter jeollabukensis]|uniref:GAF domain-containing protein n=1 Tax=Hymenobacter jeollabukensis TaxID=2025313 RepID=A0A5R8WX18_9BACT|nr:GAF domain-containing protein [Hymenobacter jeollabukensis]TLM96724.1 GAF domain-containing protein [Hymenobacter jeollabukensis]